MANDINELNSELRARFPGETLVFGDGNVHARLILIGEAPGEKEALEGRPFVGKAGKNLDEFLLLSGLKRSDLYITNAVKLRPTKPGKSGRNVNRAPTASEIEAFRPFLLREIELISPRFVATLGNVPLCALTGQKLSIGDCHAQMINLGAYTLYPMYHPASVIYNRALKKVYEADVTKLGELMLKHA